MVEINVLRSPNREEFTRIAFFKDRGFRIHRDLPKEGALLASGLPAVPPFGSPRPVPTMQSLTDLGDFLLIHAPRRTLTRTRNRPRSPRRRREPPTPHLHRPQHRRNLRQQPTMHRRPRLPRPLRQHRHIPPRPRLPRRTQITRRMANGKHLRVDVHPIAPFAERKGRERAKRCERGMPPVILAYHTLPIPCDHNVPSPLRGRGLG